MSASLRLCRTFAAMAMGEKSFIKLTEFYQKTMVLEVERVDEECDNLEQRQARMDFYKRNGFRTTNAFLEYEGLSFEILYLGHHFDEEAYRDIFPYAAREELL